MIAERSRTTTYALSNLTQAEWMILRISLSNALMNGCLGFLGVMGKGMYDSINEVTSRE